jgi:hypothetical protein
MGEGIRGWEGYAVAWRHDGVEGRTVVEGGVGADVGGERETVNAWEDVLLSCLKYNVK